MSDPTTTWSIPLDAAGLSVRSDGRYVSGGYSVYANGVCGVTGKLFATTAASNSGDATLNMTSNKGCRPAPRTVTIDYGDQVETSSTFINLHEIENTTTSIPIGTTVPRHLRIQSVRCDALQFGQNAASDDVLVTRVDGHTWHVKSQASPNDRANCMLTGTTYHMQVDLVVTASRDLP